MSAQPASSHAPLWDSVLRPRGPVTRALRRAGLSALGTYGAYVVYGLAHPALLRPAVSAADRASQLPGDTLVAEPDWVSDFAVDILAPPAAIWPWLVQLGYGRAGWYSWFPLDNGGVPSADTIVPELQRLAVGDVVPDGPRAAEGFGVWRVHTLEPARALVLYSRRDPVTGYEVPAGGPTAGRSFMECSWAFVLSDRADHTRLQVRVRVRFVGGLRGGLAGHATRMLFGLGDNVMENTMLSGIRIRAERAWDAARDQRGAAR